VIPIEKTSTLNDHEFKNTKKSASDTKTHQDNKRWKIGNGKDERSAKWQGP
jgi:hypothetical protein